MYTMAVRVLVVQMCKNKRMFSIQMNVSYHSLSIAGMVDAFVQDFWSRNCCCFDSCLIRILFIAICVCVSLFLCLLLLFFFLLTHSHSDSLFFFFFLCLSHSFFFSVTFQCLSSMAVRNNWEIASSKVHALLRKKNANKWNQPTQHECHICLLEHFHEN